MLDSKDMAETVSAAPPELAFRDDEGVLRPEYVEQVAEAIRANDAASLRQRAAVDHLWRRRCA